MLKITIPNYCIDEVKYSFHCLFGLILGIKYDIEIDRKVTDFVISTLRGKLVIHSVFFNTDETELLYSGDNLPEKTELSKCYLSDQCYIYENIYGQNEYTVSESTIELHSDIIASTFFMLSRWEEGISDLRDAHNRFPAVASLAVKNNFIDRAVVNEYADLLLAAIRHIGWQGIPKARAYKIIPTHDIDYLYLFNNKRKFIRSLAHSFLSSPSLIDVKNKLVSKINSRDIYNTFDLLMSKAESVQSKAIFYFIAGGDSSFEGNYSVDEKACSEVIERIKVRNHTLGLHPSYYSYLDMGKLNVEKTKLEQLASVEITHSRQHFLRFETPTTWAMLDNVGVKVDSTVGYPDRSGFRCGICDDFPVFDFRNRRMLDLIERPLIVMDTTLLQYEKRDASNAVSRVRHLQLEVQKHKGTFTFLWHNSSFGITPWREYGEVFNQMYDQAV